MYKFITFIVLITLCCFACKEEQVEVEKKRDKFADKFYPQYLRDLERAFPDTHVNVKAYKRGKLEVQQDVERKKYQRDGLSLPWTVQGPGNLGARINAIDQDPDNKNIIYAGFAGGGLWRTMDGGINWTSIFDDEVYNSISEITVDPSNPGTLYIGTGDPNVPGRAYIGSGVYKSEDYGENWTHLGLEKQRVISKIKIHPDDPSILFAGSMGLPFVADDSRGLYRSIDGGTSWEKIFFVSDSTGISDFIINPENPDYFYVATWDRVRNNEVSLIVGEGSGIYLSRDSGASWDKAVGIPDTTLSRTGLAICKGAPNNVYAVTVATDFEVGGIYRSSDFGENFTEIPTDSLFTDDRNSAFAGFGWYFAKLAIDPTDPDHIYTLAVDLWETYDAGGDWDPATPIWYLDEVHADKHDMMIDDDGVILLATDGGLYNGIVGDVDAWQDMENIPTTQFYRVGYNPHEPDIYYGGAQDNGTTRGNVDNINNWDRLLGGDGFQPVFDPRDPDHWFGEVQFGTILMTQNGGEYFNTITGNLPGSANWDTPYFLSPHSADVLYMGRESVFKSNSSYDVEWEEISENLTESSSAFESSLNTTISALDESPIIPGKLYAGTTNGIVQTTDDDGRSWTDITDGLPSRFVTSVKASPSFDETVYVTLSGYKDYDFIPRVYRSDNSGGDWVSIGDNLPDIAVNDILIIPGFEDRIIFIATDGGVYVSIDFGDNWSRLGSNMPNVVCYDMEYNVANEELIVATFGRAIMTYPLQELLLPVTSVTDLAANTLKLSISPNPSSDFITVTTENELVTDYKLDILDNIGRKVLSTQNQSRVDVSGLIAGSYNVLLKTKERVHVGRLVVE